MRKGKNKRRAARKLRAAKEARDLDKWNVRCDLRQGYTYDPFGRKVFLS